MDYTSAFAISAAGMAVERTRVDVSALNLANANTVLGADGSNYQPLRVVAQAAPRARPGHRLVRILEPRRSRARDV